MKIQPQDYNSNYHKQYKVSLKARIHIVDGFLHADTMEHFAKAVLKDVKNVDSLKMHYVECNPIDINTKQMSSLEAKLKEMNNSLRLGSEDYVAIPGLASVPILNLQDRIRNVLKQSVHLTAQNLRGYKNTILNLLKEFYLYQHYYSDEVAILDKNSQELQYTYGVINEINKLSQKGVNVYIPAGHGADSTIKWMIKSQGLNNDYTEYLSKNRDRNNDIKRIFKQAEQHNYYDFNLLALSNAHIVNVKNKNDRDFIFAAKDGYMNDGARGVYNFSPVRNSSGRIIGYSFTDKSTVEYPYDEFQANERLANISKYVGLQIRDFYPSHDEIEKFKKMVRQGHSTADLPERLYPISTIFVYSYIERNKLDRVGSFINTKQNLIFDTNSDGEILFQKTNCEGSNKPSVMQMWGSCFSAINALKRDVLGVQERNYSSYYYIDKANSEVSSKHLEGAEFYYNKALEVLHPNKTNLNCNNEAIETYEKLYDVLKQQHKYEEAKGVANILLNLKAYKIKDKFIFNPFYLYAQSKLAKYYEEIAIYCENSCEYYLARVCRWAAQELKKNSEYGDRIVQRRAEQNQYIGDLYDECH